MDCSHRGISKTFAQAPLILLYFGYLKFEGHAHGTLDPATSARPFRKQSRVARMHVIPSVLLALACHGYVESVTPPLPTLCSCQ